MKSFDAIGHIEPWDTGAEVAKNLSCLEIIFLKSSLVQPKSQVNNLNEDIIWKN